MLKCTLVVCDTYVSFTYLATSYAATSGQPASAAMRSVLLTSSKFVDAPLSMGPTRRPSSSRRRRGFGDSISPVRGGSGACTKQVKCRSVCMSCSVTVVWPALAASAWMFAKSGVVSRAFARSSGVISAHRT